MKRVKLVLFVALAVGLYTAATVSPAAGARKAAAPRVAKQIASCMPAVAGEELFSVYSTLTPAAFGGGFDAGEALSSDVVADLPVSAKGTAGRNFRATVPVYFHVI